MTTFPDYNPVIVNIFFSLVAGVSSMVFGKLGDLTVRTNLNYMISFSN